MVDVPDCSGIWMDEIELGVFDDDDYEGLLMDGWEPKSGDIVFIVSDRSDKGTRSSIIEVLWNGYYILAPTVFGHRTIAYITDFDLAECITDEEYENI